MVKPKFTDTIFNKASLPSIPITLKMLTGEKLFTVTDNRMK